MMGQIARSLALVVLACGALQAIAAEAGAFTAQDLFRLQWAQDPQISPSGRRIAYVRSANDIMTDGARTGVSIIDVGTGRETEVSSDQDDLFLPRWSADESTLVYVRARSGRFTVELRRSSDASTITLVSLDTPPNSLAWSRDGKQLALTLPTHSRTLPKLHTPLTKPQGASWAEGPIVTDRLNYRVDGRGLVGDWVDQLYVVSTRSGAIRQLTSDPFDVQGPLAWSAKGDAILFASDRRPDAELHSADTEIYSLQLETRAISALTHRQGPDFAPEVSPDGSEVAYLGHDDTGRNFENNELFVMRSDGSGGHSLTHALDRNVDQAHWCGERVLCFSYVDRGIARLAQVSLDGKVTPIAGGLAGPMLELPMILGSSFSTSTHGAVAYTGGDAWHPPDVHLATRGANRPLTRLNEWLAHRSLARVEPFGVTTGLGIKLDAWLVRPPSSNRGTPQPLILEIHGGPYQAYGPAFSTADQLYAAAGYTVLYLNPRGSTSYGADFAHAIEDQFPGVHYDDLVAAVDAAVAAGVADPRQLFVTGASAGALMTAWVIGKSDRFKAAAVQLPVVNWTSWRLTTDNPGQYFPSWFAKRPWEDPVAYWERSPLSLVGHVATPTLIVDAGNDYIARPSEAEQYFTALKLRGVPTELVTVPGVGHNSIAQHPSQSAAKIEAILEWFKRHPGREP